MREELRLLYSEERGLNNKQAGIETEAFKNLLADEYGLARTHPKFEKVYNLAYEHGHGSGFSDIENCFSEFVELIKD